jgi:putative colanic acid biosynthesis acetyltransferase WcaF
MNCIDLTKSVSPFSSKEKLLRFFWSFLVWPIVRFIPFRPGSKLRVLALRAFGAKIGSYCLVEPGCKIWMPWNLTMIEYVAIGRNVEIYNYGMVSIGRMTVVSQYCYLCTGSHDYTHPHMPLIWDNITLGSEAWVAAGTWILPGVSVGDGTVIGARSLVAKNLPAWSVCAGHPCKVVKPRIVKGLPG